MSERPNPKFRPALERLEPKQPLAGGAAAAPLAHRAAGPTAAAARADGGGTIKAEAIKPHFGYLVYRVTNPSKSPPNVYAPPFGHVLVQDRQPIPGQTYNILLIALKNATDQTFDSRSRFFVRLPYQHYFPILTGDQTWKPGQSFIFYILTKQYYPLPNQVSSGFQFNLDGAWSTAIPGPSGIFLRIKYNPATINKILDYAVTMGPGAQGGAGIPTAMADTALWAFVSARKKRNDFGGYF